MTTSSTQLRIKVKNISKDNYPVFAASTPEFFTAVSQGKELLWLNPDKEPFSSYQAELDFTPADVRDASARLQRFAPVIEACFPETAVSHGIIESSLTEIPAMRDKLQTNYGIAVSGRLFLKQDGHLPVSGSVKARGGIYEVLKHTEDLALAEGILTSEDDDYLKLLSPVAKKFFAQHKIQVGSTGNLGLSIGIMAAALGYEAIVHMSADARQWKKDLLRQRGAIVCEYTGDYALAVENGRRLSASDPSSYFVDDEHSRDLFCGYAVAGERLRNQLTEKMITVDEEHPLYVYIPCGVGGAPGGITYGLKLAFGDNVHVFYAEPVQSPCMLVGLASGKNSGVCVQDYGLSGKTQADGLAVARCSELVAANVRHLIDGEGTVGDEHLNPFIKALWGSEKIFIEPSAGAAFQPYIMDVPRIQNDNATHIIWATGGNMVPAAERQALMTIC